MLPQRPTVNNDVSYILKTLSGPPAFMTGSTNVDESLEPATQDEDGKWVLGKRKLLTTFNKDSARRFRGVYLADTLWDWWKHYIAIPVQVLLLFWAVSAPAFTITNAGGTLSVSNANNVVWFTWDAQPGYSFNLYWGDKSRGYTNVTSVGSTNFAKVDLGKKNTNNVTYFFAATGVDTLGESDFSNEATYNPPPLPPIPSNLRPPVRLTIQEKKSLLDFMWADTTMTWDLSPGDPGSFYRLAVSKPVVPPPASLLRPVITLPPLPGEVVR